MSENTDIQWDWADNKVHPAVRYPSTWVTGTGSGEDTIIGMIKSFNPRVTTPKDVINSLNDYNQGFVSKPPEYYIDITCAPFGDGYDILMGCMNGDRYFDVVLAPITDYDITDDDVAVGQPVAAWGPQREVFKGCKITDLNERYAMGTEPTVTFTCRALRFTWQSGTNAMEVGDGIAGRIAADSALKLSTGTSV